MTKKKTNTYVGIVLDSSGSMMTGKEVTISSFNEQLQTIQKGAKDLEGKTKVTFITFNDDVKPLFSGVTPENLSPLTTENYRPNGCTALYDAINNCIESIKEQQGKKDKDAAVLMIILTDGMENASKTISGSALGEKVKSLEDSGKWTFTLMGPSDQIQSMASILNVKSGNISGFNVHSVESRAIAGASMSSSLGNYFSLRSQDIEQVNSFYDKPNNNTKVDDENSINNTVNFGQFSTVVNRDKQ